MGANGIASDSVFSPLYCLRPVAFPGSTGPGWPETARYHFACLFPDLFHHPAAKSSTVADIDAWRFTHQPLCG